MDLLPVSQNIRKLRRMQGMTLDQLAEKSTLSKGFLSQVENFRLTPSLKALNRIAEALGTDLTALFQTDTPHAEYTFGNMEKGERVSRDDGEDYGIFYHALAYRQIDRIMDPFLIEYTPSDAEREFKMHDTEEFYLLLEGELDFFLMNESGPVRMKAGDTLYMKANIPHKVRLAPGCRHARALSVYTRPE